MDAVDRFRLTRSLKGVALWKWGTLLLGVVLLVLAFVLESSPTQAVASVEGKRITLSNYNRWLLAYAVEAHSSDSEVPPFPPDAPGFSRCIAYERKAVVKSGKKAPSTSSLRSSCRSLNTELAESTLELLVTGQWFIDQGRREHVSVSSSQVRSELHASFPKTSGLVHFLSSNKLTRPDLEFEVRAYLTAERLSSHHSGRTPTISSSQIQSYYNSNRSQIGKETLAKATPAIRATLIAQAQAPTLDSYLSGLQTYWEKRTTCAQGYRVAGYCKS